MYARAVDEAAERLRELHREEWQELILAALALGVSLAATKLYPPLAVPLFLGGLAVGALGIRALWRRWDLIDRLAGESDAYVISEVLAYASREATMERRLALAACIRTSLREPVEARIRAATEDLEALVAQLEDEQLALHPACAVACMRLLTDVAESPLLNTGLPPEDVRGRLRQIRAGFEPHRARNSAAGPNAPSASATT